MTISPDNILLKFLIIALMMALFTDVRSMRIPNLLTFTSMIIAISFHGYNAGFGGVAFSIAGLLTGMGLLIPFYILGGMGGGDVKLMGAVGAVLGTSHAISAFAYIAIIGGLYAIFKMALHHRSLCRLCGAWKESIISIVLTRKFIPSPGNTGLQSPKLCYGIAICFGTLAYLWIQHTGSVLI